MEGAEQKGKEKGYILSLSATPSPLHWHLPGLSSLKRQLSSLLPPTLSHQCRLAELRSGGGRDSGKSIQERGDPSSKFVGEYLGPLQPPMETCHGPP